MSEFFCFLWTFRHKIHSDGTVKQHSVGRNVSIDYGETYYNPSAKPSTICLFLVWHYLRSDLFINLASKLRSCMVLCLKFLTQILVRDGLFERLSLIGSAHYIFFKIL